MTNANLITDAAPPSKFARTKKWEITLEKKSKFETKRFY